MCSAPPAQAVSVNTTDSAVRITHLPTGIVVSCQNEKSQLQNKVAAMRVLQSRLLERARQEREAQLNALRGDGGNSWGSQMRSYVLHPYQMVKDLRTDYEVSNPDAVFDGDIDGFIESGIRWRKMGNGKATRRGAGESARRRASEIGARPGPSPKLDAGRGAARLDPDVYPARAEL